MQEEIHPNYTEKVTKDLSREHGLHRLVAGSAFVFALCVLPVAQYFLVQSRGATTASTEKGEVAGVSVDVATAEPDVFAAAPTLEALPKTLAECKELETKELGDLQRFIDGKKKAMLTNYETAVQPYRYALAAVNPANTDVQTERDELTALIEQEYQPYLQELATVEQLVIDERQRITSRVCPE